MPPAFCYALLSYKLRNIQTLVYAPVGGRYIFPEVNEYRVCFSFKFIALHTGLTSPKYLPFSGTGQI